MKKKLLTFGSYVLVAVMATMVTLGIVTLEDRTLHSDKRGRSRS